MRIAAIDIGTNSIHMVIAETSALGTFEVLDRERDVVQIGRGSFRGGRLRGDAIRRSVDALSRFCDLARRHNVDTILCTATAAVREARNGGEFLRAARRAAGVSPLVIPAEEEGRLIYLAVRAAIRLEHGPSVIVDIGGGSMQLVVGTPERMLLATSAPVGALRLTEVLEPGDPPSQRDLARMRRQVRKHAAAAIARVRELKPGGRVYGSSGSIHALAHISHVRETGEPLGQVNEHVLSLDALRRTTRRLARMTLREREALQGMDAHRAEIILPGAVALEHVLEELGAEGIVLSDYGVREGIVTDYLIRHGSEIVQLAGIADLRLRSVLALLNRLQADATHPRHVAMLALALYDELQGVHELPVETRDLLHFAALLHDIGTVIGHGGHAEHSSYVIRNGGLRGLSAEAIDIIGAVARYHGKRRPRKGDPVYRALGKRDRRTVRWLAALLRIAEGLDRSHYQLVRGVRLARNPKGISILCAAGQDVRLEIWAARRRTGLLERLLDGNVRVALDPASRAGLGTGNQRPAARGPSSRAPSAESPAHDATRHVGAAVNGEPGALSRPGSRTPSPPRTHSKPPAS